jgi:hypothetical protein
MSAPRAPLQRKFAGGETVIYDKIGTKFRGTVGFAEPQSGQVGGVFKYTLTITEQLEIVKT